MSNTPNPSQYVPLSRETIQKMIEALREINRINTKAIKERDDDAKLAMATSFLGSNLMRHAREFLGTWLTVANEYEPLVQAFGTLQLRAANFAAERAKVLGGVTHEPAEPPQSESGSVDPSQKIITP